MAAAPNEVKTNDIEKKEKSPFEKACDKLKKRSTPDEMIDEIKEYKNIENTIRLWPTHQNPNKNCRTCVSIIKPCHCSNTIREKLSDYIPNDCSLNYCCFSKGAGGCSGYDLKTFQFIHGASLIALFAGAVNCDQKLGVLTLKHVIGTKQFDFIFKAVYGNYAQNFWMKMVGAAAYVKACGTSQRTDCMTFAPLIAISLGPYGLLVLKATKGRVGVGFCNLIEDPRRKTKRKHVIKGNAMIMIRDDNIQDVEIEFYVKRGASSNNFGISFESVNLSKNGYDNPLVLISPTAVAAQLNTEQKQEAQQSAPDLLANASNNYQNYASQPIYTPQPSYQSQSNFMMANPLQFADYNSILAPMQIPHSNMYGVGSRISNLSMPLPYPGAFSVGPMIPPLPIPIIPILNNNQLNQQNNQITYSNIHQSNQESMSQRYSPY